MAEMNKVIGVIGWQNSGKTTLVVELVKLRKVEVELEVVVLVLLMVQMVQVQE